ncbi:hypothetical protein HJC23_008339 [Cyclotella cryptica]|uniref:Uncharacterized protein n=1 Tax=Cyclotella cryptica TaxID=29204 RepID=A0ABD3Q5U4_9STRA|eukprot:CCRYP_008625-RA/>CCRYP_008625-RA protein AED:0.43 eAED:0.43 QI:0/-1/0/1/-1/1/1/0/598
MKRQSSQSFNENEVLKNEPRAAPPSKPTSVRMIGGKSEKRRLAALKCWEKRRAHKDIALSSPVTIVPSIDDELNTPDARNTLEDVQPKTDNSLQNDIVNNTPSGRAGGKSNKRRLAALKIWEKRRKERATSSLTPGASPSSAKDGCNPSQRTQDDNGNAANELVCAEAPSLKRRYTAELRSQASKAAWEKRRLKAKAAKKSSSNVLTNSASSEDATDDSTTVVQAESNTNATKKRKKQNHGGQQRPELKRSRPRRTSQDCATAADTTKDANELITRLRFSRGWMEFHPSSRYGNGTADYAYIPGSLAQLIRNGAFSKPIVLENGTLGIHYALDYEGYGGLKAMIETFGEDYSPFPSEKMMEASRELQDKKDAKIEQWDIGDDLPWREATQFEDDDIEKKCDKRRNELQQQAITDPLSDTPDIEAVAEILASLIEANCADLPCSDQAYGHSTTIIHDTKSNNRFPVDVASSNENRKSTVASPALLALQCYESDDDSPVTTESSIQELSKQQEMAAAEVTCMTYQDLIDNQSTNDTTIKSYDVELEKSFSTAPCSIFGIPLHSESDLTQHSKKQYEEKERVFFTQGCPSLVFNDWNFGLR